MRSPLATLLFSTLILMSGPLQAQVITHCGPDGYVKIENGSAGLAANLEPGDRKNRADRLSSGTLHHMLMTTIGGVTSMHKIIKD